MATESVQAMLKEHEAELLCDRRAVARKPFTRPVRIAAGKNRDEIHEAFSRDISPQGIGIISRVEWRERSVVGLTVHSVRGKALTVDAEARWTKEYGNGWFLTGWVFLGQGK